MQAAVYNVNSTNFDDISVTEVAKPVANADSVLVKIVSAAINPVDWKVSAGYLKGAGWGMPLPFVPGYDFAGVVEAVGSNVTNFAVGDRVFAVNWGKGSHDVESNSIGGAFAEYIAIDAGKVSKLPENVTFEEGAAVALVGTTAYEALNSAINLQAGQRILILGGSGAVGQIAIQLAKLKGAWVATTASTRTVSFVESFGADKVINYNTSNWTEDADLKNIDAVFDTIGESGSFEKAKTILKSDGSYVNIADWSCGFDPKGHAPLNFASFLCLSNNTATQDQLAQLIANKQLRVVIEQEFPFTTQGVRDLFAKQQASKSLGKNVLKVSSA